MPTNLMCKKKDHASKLKNGDKRKNQINGKTMPIHKIVGVSKTKTKKIIN